MYFASTLRGWRSASRSLAAAWRWVRLVSCKFSPLLAAKSFCLLAYGRCRRQNWLLQIQIEDRFLIYSEDRKFLR